MKTALIVDDDKFFCELLVQALGRCVKDCAIVTAGNGKEAAAIMHASRVDFIITDLNMPEMDGYKFLSYARAHYPDVPALVVTETKTPDVEKRLRAIGITRCIEKTFDIKDMVPLILGELGGIVGEGSLQPLDRAS
jgi:CheY-like chemotaxis protein